jgi:FixJ family two-component response regulator
MVDRSTKRHLPTVSLLPSTPGAVHQAHQTEPIRIQTSAQHHLSKSRAKAMAAETEKVMIQIAQGGHLSSIAAELEIPISILNQRIALYGLRAAKICDLKGV